MGSLAKAAKAKAAETTLQRAGDAEHDPADLGGKPGVKLLDIALGELTPNPRNPRKENLHEDPATIELAASMKDVGQLQSAVVVTRETYLKQWPEDADKVPTAYVLMIGNRRWAAADRNEWPALECLIRDRITKDLEKLGRLPMHENIHRKGINALEIAYWLQDEMTLHNNNQSEVARTIRKSQPWVNQYLQLLKLIPELQDLVQADELTATGGRAIAKLDKEEQLRLWEHVRDLDPEERAGFWSGSGAGYKSFIAPPPTAPETTDDSAASEAAHQQDSAAPPEDAQPAAKPAPRNTSSKGAIVIRIEDGSPTSLAAALRAKFSTEELAELVKALMAEAV